MKERVETERAPRAIGPYSQAIRTGGLIFASGQIPLDPRTGQFVDGGIAEQTVQVLNNLKSVLEASGSSLELVVKTTVFLANLGDFAEMNEAYGRFFGDSPPARSTVEVTRLPKDAKIEIDAIALSGPV